MAGPSASGSNRRPARRPSPPSPPWRPSKTDPLVPAQLRLGPSNAVSIGIGGSCGSWSPIDYDTEAPNYLKQVAQATVAEVEGVVAVINQIEVIASRNGPPIGRDCGSRRDALVPAESSSEVQAEPPTRNESRTMLVLGRKVHEKIAISDNIRITVLRIRGNQVRLGVEAPEYIKVVREELSGPGDAGLAAGVPTAPRPPDLGGTDVEPSWVRSHREPRPG